MCDCFLFPFSPKEPASFYYLRAAAATADAESATCGASSAPGVWYSVVGNGGSMSATTCHADTTYDTRLSLFTGGCGALECVTSNDDSCDISGTRSTVNWESEDGATYLILVHGYNSNSGDFTLVVDQSAPDADGDGVPDSEDACPGSDDNIDTDGDGIPDGCDADAPVGPFVRGDANGDATVNISDATAMLNWLFMGADEPGCVASNDSNADGAINISDPTHLLNFLFLGGPAPPAPTECATSDLESDIELGCSSGGC